MSSEVELKFPLGGYDANWAYANQPKATTPSWLNVPLQGPQMTILIGFTILAILTAIELLKAVQLVLSGEKLEGKIAIVEDKTA